MCLSEGAWTRTRTVHLSGLDPALSLPWCSHQGWPCLRAAPPTLSISASPIGVSGWVTGEADSPSPIGTFPSPKLLFSLLSSYAVMLCSFYLILHFNRLDTDGKRCAFFGSYRIRSLLRMPYLAASIESYSKCLCRDKRSGERKKLSTAQDNNCCC
jgi:hypothetical protein